MNLYFIRHGQSVTNLQGVFTGQADVPLTEEGCRDARRAGELLRGISFDRVYASDLSRAMRTAELALPGVAYETTPLLREYDLGELALQSVAACREKYAPDFTENQRNGNYLPYGGENVEMIHARIRAFLSSLPREGCERIAVFTHGGLINAAFDLLLGLRDRCRRAMDNGAISVFRIEDGRASLLTWNCTGRLPDSGTDPSEKPI